MKQNGVFHPLTVPVFELLGAPLLVDEKVSAVHCREEAIAVGGVRWFDESGLQAVGMLLRLTDRRPVDLHRASRNRAVLGDPLGVLHDDRAGRAGHLKGCSFVRLVDYDSIESAAGRRAVVVEERFVDAFEGGV